MAVQRYAAYKIAQDPTGPSPRGFAVTTHDTNELTEWVRAVTINASGTLVYVNWDGVDCTTGTLPAGTYPLLAKIIKTTSTATGITGWV